MVKGGSLIGLITCLKLESAVGMLEDLKSMFGLNKNAKSS